MSLPVYLYDMGKLIFKFDSTSGQNNNVVIGTGIYLKHIRLLLTTGSAYLGRFVLSRTTLNLGDVDFVNTLSMLEVKELFRLHKIQVPVKRGRPLLLLLLLYSEYLIVLCLILITFVLLVLGCLRMHNKKYTRVLLLGAYVEEILRPTVGSFIL